MHYWKILSSHIEQMRPEWRNKFLSYKILKKQLKLIYPKDGSFNALARPNKRLRHASEDSGADGEVAKEVTDFVNLLKDEIKKFNVFFVNKEEEYVMELKALKDNFAVVSGSSERLMDVLTKIVDLHGEMVLLENYSALNYIGVVKILKKYDKRSGALIRSPFIQNVLRQPFFRTDVLNKLVKDCETILGLVLAQNEPSVTPEATEVLGPCEDTGTENKEMTVRVPENLEEIGNLDNMYVKLTISALKAMKEIRSGSSTVSDFSLPPLHGNEWVRFG